MEKKIVFRKLALPPDNQRLSWSRPSCSLHFLATSRDLRRGAAEELLARHQGGWEALLRATLALTHDLHIIALESGQAHLLLGISPREYPVPEALAGKADGP